MEMMALGLPVIAYNGEYTKYHAKVFDLHSIADKVRRCWKDLNKKDSTLKADTIKYAQKNFNRAIEVKKHIQLYKDLLGE